MDGGIHASVRVGGSAVESLFDERRARLVFLSHR